MEGRETIDEKGEQSRRNGTQEPIAIAWNRGREVLARLCGELRELWTECVDATEAQFPDWQELYLKVIGRRSDLVMVTARAEDGRLIAAASFMTRSAAWSPSGLTQFLGERDADYHVFLARPGTSLVTGRRMIERLIEKSFPFLGAIEFRNVPAESWTGKVLKEFRDANVWNPNLTTWRNSETYAISLPESMDAYWAMLEPSARKRLQYELRRLKRDFLVELHIPDTADQLAKALDEVVAIHKRRWGSDSMLNHPREEEFLRASVKLLHDRGLCRLFLLNVDGRTVAFNIGMVLGTRVCFPFVSHDPSFPNKYSAALMCNVLTVEHCISQGFLTYDLTRGSEGYKQLLGATCHESVTVTIERSAIGKAVRSLRQQSKPVRRIQASVRQLVNHVRRGFRAGKK